MSFLKKMCLILLLVLPFVSNGQVIQKLNAKQSLKMADYLYSIGSYFNAISYYERVYEKQSNNAYAVNQIAQSQMLLRDYKEAEKWFKVLQDLGTDQYPEAGYYYALCLKYNAKYAEAKTAFDKFQKVYKGTNASVLKKKAKMQSEGCDLAISMISHPDTVKVEHIGANINAPYTEFGPVPNGNDELIYSSLKSDTIIIIDNVRKNTQFAQFYSAPKETDSTLGQSSLYKGMPINDKDAHCGNGSFSLDHKRFYFTKCKMDNTMKMHCDIYVTEIQKNGKWSNPVKLPSEINSDSTQTHPCVGKSKEGEVLYWSSNRGQGTGGMDIWYSVKNGDVWSPAMNLGKKVNTTGDDITPYYDSKSYTLYFSSNGWPGMGGFDIFKSKGSLKKWEPVKNMGYPINSSVDDMYYVLSDKKYIGYLVSNRPGTISVKSETCCDDIWLVQYPRIIYNAVRGFVFDKKTGKKIDSAKVIMVSGGDTKWGDDQFSKIDTMYFWDTKPTMSYELKATRNGYYPNSSPFSVVKTWENDTMRVDIYLDPVPPPVPIVIKNIFYNFNEATLRPESKVGLDSLYKILTDNPLIKIQVRSHTDSVGSNDYNNTLSQQRAQSVVDYLVKEKGVDPTRLEAKGMGETEPIAPNSNPDGTDNPKGRQANRRTDFKIIGIIPGTEVIYKDGDLGFDENAVDTMEEVHQKEDEQDK